MNLMSHVIPVGAEEFGTMNVGRATPCLVRGIAAAVAVVLVGWSSTAEARIVERGDYSFEDRFEEEVCGDTPFGPLTIEIEGEYAGTYTVRGDRPGSTAYFYADRFEFREVVTNPDNDRWLVIRGSGNTRDVFARHVEGDIYRYRVHMAGRPFVMESSDGDVVLSENGLLRFDVEWETLTVDPYSGQFISLEFVGAHGRWVDDEQFCQAVSALIG